MRKSIGALSAILISVMFAVPTVLAASASYTFNLKGPNVSMAKERII